MLYNKKIIDMKTYHNNIGRFYVTPMGDYPSVTTMLGNSGGKEFLDVWRERLGEEEAVRQTRVAGHLGQCYHDLGEQFLLRKPLPKRQWLAELLFKGTEPILRKNITDVHAVETCLVSHLMRLAGRTDAIVDWKGELAIFDFKCIGHHNPEWLHDYWIQLTAYSLSLQEMTGLKPNKIVLVCANKKNFKSKYFEANAIDYIKPLYERIKKFREYVNINQAVLQNNKI